MSREKTLSDLNDILLRMEALESHAKKYFGNYSHLFVRISLQDLRHAKEIEEKHNG